MHICLGSEEQPQIKGCDEWISTIQCFKIKYVFSVWTLIWMVECDFQLYFELTYVFVIVLRHCIDNPKAKSKIQGDGNKKFQKKKKYKA